MKRTPSFGRFALAAAVGLAALVLVDTAAQAGGHVYALDHNAYRQECAACHVAYPPQLLSAASWRAVMGGLDKHFGSDASLDPATRDDILRFLERNASRRDTTVQGQPALRITETRWFQKEHREELPASAFRHPAVKSAANCMACHTAADQGDYSKRTRRLPAGLTEGAER